MRNNL